jgi:hypothetical protein
MKMSLILSGWCAAAVIAICAWFEIDQNNQTVDKLEEQIALLNKWIQ